MPAPRAHNWATPPSCDTGRHDAATGAALRYRRMASIEQELDDAWEEEQVEVNHLCLLAAEEPAGVEDAKGDPSWRRAMEDELDAIRSNGTLELAALPPGHVAIGLK